MPRRRTPHEMLLMPEVPGRGRYNYLRTLLNELRPEMRDAGWSSGTWDEDGVMFEDRLSVDGWTRTDLRLGFDTREAGSEAPIIELTFAALVTAARDNVYARLREAADRGQFPSGAELVSYEDGEGLRMRVPVPWGEPGVYDPQLASRVLDACRDTLVAASPSIRSTAPPGTSRFRERLAGAMDSEMHKSGWAPEHTWRSVEYSTDDESKGPEISLFAWLGGDDPTDWSVLDVGFYATGNLEISRHGLEAIEELYARGQMPKGTELSHPARPSRRELLGRARWTWRDPAELEEHLMPRAVSTLRDLRTVLAPIALNG